MILGIIIAIFGGVIMLVLGILDIIEMANVGFTFWGLVWAVCLIVLRELVTVVVAILFLGLGGAMIE